MLAFQKGDERAFAELVRRNQSTVFAVVYRFMGDAADVEDLAQEVFLRVYRTGPRYKPTAKFSTWLYRITANLCLNAIRSRGKLRFSQLEVRDESDSDAFYREVEDTTGPAPHAALAASELQDRLRIALESLPDSQRTAIILNKYEQLSYDEIAAILDLSVMAVKSLLSRARANLRRELERYLQPEDR